MAADDKTAQEQAAMYARARVIMERLMVELQGADDHDALLALQLLVAKHGRSAGYKPEGLLRVLDTNLAEMFKVWEEADQPVILDGGKN